MYRLIIIIIAYYLSHYILKIVQKRRFFGPTTNRSTVKKRYKNASFLSNFRSYLYISFYQTFFYRLITDIFAESVNSVSGQMHFGPEGTKQSWDYNVCPRSFDPIYLVIYCIKWAKKIFGSGSTSVTRIHKINQRQKKMKESSSFFYGI